MRILKRLTVALLSAGIAARCANSQEVLQACRSLSGVASCEGSRDPIIEIPVGSVDGQNFIFRLSALPISSADVRVTVNSTEVPQGPELSIKDQDLFFHSPAVPKIGDLIRATYETQFISVANRESNLDSLIKPFASMALLRMVASENISAPGPILKESKSRTPPLTTLQTARPPGDRALALLTQRLSSVHTGGNIIANRAATEEMHSLVGVEGTGDIPLASPFDEWLNLDKRRIRTTGSAVATGSNQNQRVLQFRSLRMLQDRLNGDPSK